jgi:hypothetical protein
MGKRELVIIAAFVLIGVVAYQFTAPAPKEGEEGFSLRKIFSEFKREVGANSASARVTKAGTIALRADVKALRVSAEGSVPVTIIGEARDDIAYEMPVESTGPDEASARGYAERSILREDDLGEVLGLTTTFPDEGTQTAKLTLHVPERLLVRVEGSRRVQVSQVASVDLRNIAGETSVSKVTAVTGTHRAGDLTVSGAATVDLTLVSSRAKIRDVTQSIQINARNGECAISNSTGTIAMTTANVEVTIDHHSKGAIKVAGETGELTLNALATPLSVDARRMRVELKIEQVLPEDITVITSEEPLRVTISGDAALVIDAVANHGAVKVTDFDWTPSTNDRDSRLTATLGRGGARAVLRNAGGDIVISRRK